MPENRAWLPRENSFSLVCVYSKAAKTRIFSRNQLLHGDTLRIDCRVSCHLVIQARQLAGRNLNCGFVSPELSCVLIFNRFPPHSSVVPVGMARIIHFECFRMTMTKERYIEAWTKILLHGVMMLMALFF